MTLTLVLGDIQIPYYLLNPDAVRAVYSDVPSWFPLYAIFGLALSIAIIIGMWQMKKWAVYLLAAYFVSKAPTEMFMFNPSQQTATIATTVVGAALWAWAIYRKWSLFS
jgi:hypothetical protein